MLANGGVRFQVLTLSRVSNTKLTGIPSAHIESCVKY